MRLLPARMRLDHLDQRTDRLLTEARAGNPATLAELGDPHGPIDRSMIQAWLAAGHGFDTWADLVDAVALRTILNDRDTGRLAAVLAADPRRASAEMTGWCDHRGGVAPLNYIAMLRFDAPRLGLSGDLVGTGEIARQLLGAGAPVNGRPDDRETPLMTAASYGDAAVAQVLIDAGADLDAHAAEDAGGVPGGTALRHAAVFGMTDVLDALVAAGAAVESFPEAAATGDVTHWPLADATPDEQLRALIMAADHQRLDIIRNLVAHGVPVDGTDLRWGGHPLRTAARNGRPRSVSLLLRLGADPALAEPGTGLTPLELTTARHRYLDHPGHRQVAELLTDAIS